MRKSIFLRIGIAVLGFVAVTGHVAAQTGRQSRRTRGPPRPKMPAKT